MELEQLGSLIIAESDYISFMCRVVFPIDIT